MTSPKSVRVVNQKRRVPKRKAKKDRNAEYLARLPERPRVVAEALIARKIRPSLYKDYVVIWGASLIDAWGSYPVELAEGVEVPANKIAVIHKSKLAPIIGADQAALFWNAKLKKRTSYGAENKLSSRAKGSEQ